VLSISVFLASIDAQEWEDCVDSHRDDEEQSFVDTCYSHTQALKECMDRNPEYYQTINVRFLNLTSFRMYSMYLESVDPCPRRRRTQTRIQRRRKATGLVKTLLRANMLREMKKVSGRRAMHSSLLLLSFPGFELHLFIHCTIAFHMSSDGEVLSITANAYASLRSLPDRSTGSASRSRAPSRHLNSS